MTSTTAATDNTNAKKNVPSHEIFVVEGNGEESTWTKVGVAFPTKTGTSHRVLIGKRGDPKQKVYLVCPRSFIDRDDGRPGDEPKRNIFADIFEATNNEVNFKRRDGVAFLNRDESLSLLIGDRGDPEQKKYQMREVRRQKPRAAR
jgi:hypothetical protein